MSDYIKKIKTADGDKQIDYTALANLPKQYTDTGQNEDGWMTQKAITDLLTAVTNAIVAKVADVSLPAANWEGSDNLYSQVVSISGVTENSQVNLTPSVEQMAIFYEKDITFVTENDGGVVTVYVIGQKPENDYTIQANIVEVSV